MYRNNQINNLNADFIEKYIVVKNTRGIKQLIITFNKFFDSYYVFAGANVNLFDALDDQLGLRGWEAEDEEVFRLFLRGEHIKSTILSYNSIEDYMLQIITFAFNLKGKKIFSEKDFRNKSKNLYYEKVINSVKKKCKNREVLEVLKKYHNDSDIKEIRKISNKLKHNNNIRFKGLPNFYNGVRMNGLDFKAVWFEPKEKDMDDLINLCIRANKKIKSYIEQIYNLVANEYELKIYDSNNS